jgi:hypothetical protein
MQKTDLLGLIDADFIKYLVIYDITKMFKNGLSQDAVIPDNTIIDLTEKRIQFVERATQAVTKDYIYLFSGKTKDNYRSAVACVKKYKGSRKYVDGVPLEGHYRDAVEMYIKDNYNYYREPTLEADDLCVMAHTEGTYIYSHDKDLRMSPGIHYDLKLKKFYLTSEDEGFRILMKQTLMGDNVDNIAGVDKIGPVSAAKLIDACVTKQECISVVTRTYTDKYGEKDGLDRFVEMYNLVNLKTSRGAWTQERYKTFFDKIEKLK